MKLSEIMSSDLAVIQPDDSLQFAAKKMRDRNVGFLPVCDGETLLGVLSDRDITVRALAEGIDPAVMLSRDLMTTPAIHCYEDEDENESVRLMAEKQIGRLVVLSRDDERVVGVISLGDLARKSSTELSAEVLQKVSAPDTSQPEEKA